MKTIQSKQPTPDYGEPWHEIIWTSLSEDGTDSRGQDIAARDGEQVAHVHYARDASFMHRIIACVNACAGIPNEILVKEYIQEAIASLNTIKKINASDCERCGAKQPFKMQCKECGSSVGCGVSGEGFDNE